MRDLLLDAANRANRYLEGLDGRSVFPTAEGLDGMSSLAGPLGDEPTDPAEVLALLDRAGSPATVATPAVDISASWSVGPCRQPSPPTGWRELGTNQLRCGSVPRSGRNSKRSLSDG